MALFGATVLKKLHPWLAELSINTLFDERNLITFTSLIRFCGLQADDPNRAYRGQNPIMNVRILPLLVSLVFIPTEKGVGHDHEYPQTVRVASVSFEPVKFDLEGNANRLEEWFRRAASGGAKIAVGPEGALEGYVVNEIIAKEASAEQMRKVALRIDSPIIQRFQALAHELDMCLVFGFAEDVAGDIFNCAIFIDHQGSIRGKYHKMQLAEGYHESWWFNRLGRHSRAFDTPYGRCGILICNDRWNPQLAKIPALDGAQFLVIPSFGSTSKAQDEAVLARGVETGLPVIEANVGVSLIVNNNTIAAVDRHRRGVTFAEITIKDRMTTDDFKRDQTEASFLQWRKDEMARRFAHHMASLEKRARDASSQISDTGQGAGIQPSVPAETENDVAWYDAKTIGLEGRAWDETEMFYDRLPARAKQLVRPPVWSLSRHTAGMCVRFLTDAESVHARWTLRSANLAMPHMPASGVSGVDLYVKFGSQWRWLANGQPKKQTNTVRLAHELPAGRREYLLYLPLYNGVTKLELGVPSSATIWRNDLYQNVKPIVFWVRRSPRALVLHGQEWCTRPSWVGDSNAP